MVLSPFEEIFAPKSASIVKVKGDCEVNDVFNLVLL
jgi:hypothetical protein